MTRTTRLMLAAGAAFALSGAAAEAATLVGLTADNHLIRIDGGTRRAMAPVRVTGIEGRLLGIDVRPADMKLYGLTDAGQIVTIDPMTGRATPVSRLSERFEGGGRATVDFNPVADRLRVMGMSGVNFRVNVENGQVAKDGQLKYQAGTGWAETMPRVVAGAYTNSMAGATATMLYTVDTMTRTLNLQAPPNDGVQQPKGEIAASLPAGVAFDIMPEAGGGNMAVLLAGNTLHHLDLANGKATQVGMISGLPQAEVIDIAVMQ
ncbi:DUF4394 domain-containing protein [Belnapia sp. T6]|uniref:DUF4394 domain-containing protein n=1 Tax=Belnapia mucosa TaxID=2804532 RepID=A0ABS1VDH3_9PROT|nr:DUF4394 domain-containing protein [Belnapia mucosa]MBL6459337.1 DUF4394 domain-containing protein [Belnapia mucosa]